MGLCGGRSPAAGCRQPKAGAGQRLGGAWVGRAGVLGFGSLRWLCGLEEVKAKSPAIAGWGVTKIPKIPKIPIALDDSGELKQLP